MLAECLSIVSTAVAVALMIAVLHMKQRRDFKCNERLRYCSPVCIVLGSGGHTTEMLTYVQCIGKQYSERHYVVADSDSMSSKRAYQCEASRKAAFSHCEADCGSFELHSVPRSREVRQGYASAVRTTLGSMLRSAPLVWRLRPKLLLCNGPGTCVPLVCAAALFDLLFFTSRSCKIVFVESVCRVTSLSLTGRIFYHLRLCDAMIVQWEELHQKYPRTVFLGRL